MKGMLIVLILPLLLTDSGCKVVYPEDSEKSTRKVWDAMLANGFDRTGYSRIMNFDGCTRIDGYRMWQGTYRSKPIALYSCVVQQPYVIRAPAGVKSLSVILALEEPASVPKGTAVGKIRSNVTPLAEKEYPTEALDIAKFVKNSDEAAPESQVVAAGRIIVECKDLGNGRLGFRINALKEPEWASFDLEDALKDERLSGDKVIVVPKPPPYTPREFAETMVKRTSDWKSPWEPWWQGTPSIEQTRSVDHPAWSSPEHVKELLTKAPPKQIVHALQFMMLKATHDPFYMTRFEEMNQFLLGLGEHDSQAVRGSFAELVAMSLHWPKDIGQLDRLLASNDETVQLRVLHAYVNRRCVPPDRHKKRLETLAESKNEYIATPAKNLLERMKEPWEWK